MASRLTNGILQILDSGASTFALIAFLIICFMTYKIPSLGSGALITFLGIVVPLITIAESSEEHRRMTIEAARPDVTKSLLEQAKAMFPGLPIPSPSAQPPAPPSDTSGK
jgi:hypothetical protein